MITGPALAACLMAAASTYQVPPAVLLGIMHVEGGRVGQAVGNTNGSYDLGPMQINTVHLPEVAGAWRISKSQAYNMIKNDGCVNVHVAAWILRKGINSSNNLTLGIAYYHSRTPKFGYVYARKVIGAMKQMNLIASK